MNRYKSKFEENILEITTNPKSSKVKIDTKSTIFRIRTKNPTEAKKLGEILKDMMREISYMKK